MRVLLTLMLWLAAPLAFAADPLSIPAITLGTNAAGAQEYSVSLQILLIMTALSFIPAFVMLMTSFTRIVIVLSLLRQALGTQSAPPTQVIVGLSLFLTFFVMGPVFDKIYVEAYQPFSETRFRFSMRWKRVRVRSRSSCSSKPGKPIWRCTSNCPTVPICKARKMYRCAC